MWAGVEWQDVDSSCNTSLDDDTTRYHAVRVMLFKPKDSSISGIGSHIDYNIAFPYSPSITSDGSLRVHGIFGWHPD